MALLGKVKDGGENLRYRSVLLAFTIPTLTSANLIDLLGHVGVGLGRLRFALLGKVKDGGRNLRYRSVLLAFTIPTLTFMNLIDL